MAFAFLLFPFYTDQYPLPPNPLTSSMYSALFHDLDVKKPESSSYRPSSK